MTLQSLSLLPAPQRPEGGCGCLGLAASCPLPPPHSTWWSTRNHSSSCSCGTLIWPASIALRQDGTSDNAAAVVPLADAQSSWPGSTAPHACGQCSCTSADAAQHTFERRNSARTSSRRRSFSERKEVYDVSSEAVVSAHAHTLVTRASPSLFSSLRTALMLTIIDCDASQRAVPTVARTAIVVMLHCAQRCGATCASVRQCSFAMRAVRAVVEGRVELRDAVADGTGGFCGGIAVPSSAAAS